MVLKILSFVLCLLAGVYLLFPLIAGAFAIGERCGPVVYVRQHHEFLYALGYNFSQTDTCRCGCVFYHRPPFYGYPCKKKTMDELSPFLQKRLNNSPEIRETFESRPKYTY